MKNRKSQSGQTVMEYVLIMGLFAVVLLLMITVGLQKGFGGAFNTYKNILMVPYTF